MKCVNKEWGVSSAWPAYFQFNACDEYVWFPTKADWGQVNDIYYEVKCAFSVYDFNRKMMMMESNGGVLWKHEIQFRNSNIFTVFLQSNLAFGIHFSRLWIMAGRKKATFCECGRHWGGSASQVRWCKFIRPMHTVRSFEEVTENKPFGDLTCCFRSFETVCFSLHIFAQSMPKSSCSEIVVGICGVCAFVP